MPAAKSTGGFASIGHFFKAVMAEERNPESLSESDQLSLDRLRKPPQRWWYDTDDQYRNAHSAYVALKRAAGDGG